MAVWMIRKLAKGKKASASTSTEPRTRKIHHRASPPKRLITEGKKYDL